MMGSTSTPWVPDRGDVILISLHARAGKDVVGEMTLLVLSPRLFNERTGIAIGLPVSPAEVQDTNPFAVKHVDPGGIACYVLTHQPQTVDWRAYGAREHPWMKLPQDVLGEACDGLNQIIQLGG